MAIANWILIGRICVSQVVLSGNFLYDQISEFDVFGIHISCMFTHSTLISQNSFPW